MGKLRKIVPLTDEQRQLVADNIKLPQFVINKYCTLTVIGFYGKDMV